MDLQFIPTNEPKTYEVFVRATGYYLGTVRGSGSGWSAHDYRVGTYVSNISTRQEAGERLMNGGRK